MTTANVVYAGPASANCPMMKEAQIALGQTLVGGNLVELSSGEWVAHATADVGGDIYVIDMDTVGQKAVTATLTPDQTSAAFIPEVGKRYNLILAAGQAVTVGTSLASNGDGAVKIAATDGTSEALFVAEEGITTTGATGRITARYNPTGANATA